MEKYETEILETEKAFARLAKEQGLKIAFLAYASDQAVLNRNGKLIKGRKEIEEYFDQQTSKNVHLEWTPDFVSVAASGDLGYTYGKFTFEGTDEAGHALKSEGFFHTVWKRDPNGEWRYVWD